MGHIRICPGTYLNEHTHIHTYTLTHTQFQKVLEKKRKK